MENQVVKYDINTAAIAEMAKIYMDLTISDLENEDEFNAVHSARMVVKGHRVRLDKDVKKHNDIANSFKKEVKEKAKPLYDGMKPIETHLWDEENKVLEEQKRIKEEEAAREKEIIQGRIDALFEYGVTMPFLEVAAMTEEEFQPIILKVKTDWEAEKARIAEEARAEDERFAKEEADRKAEKKRLAEEREHLLSVAKHQEAKEANLRAVQDKILAEQKEAQDKIDADRKALNDAREAERDRLAKDRLKQVKAVAEGRHALLELVGYEVDGDISYLGELTSEDWEITYAAQKENFEKARTEAKTKADKELKERLEREEQDQLAREADEKKEAARQEALKPDKEKLTGFANELLLIKGPEIESGEARTMLDAALVKIGATAMWLKTECDKL